MKLLSFPFLVLYFTSHPNSCRGEIAVLEDGRALRTIFNEEEEQRFLVDRGGSVNPWRWSRYGKDAFSVEQFLKGLNSGNQSESKAGSRIKNELGGPVPTSH